MKIKRLAPIRRVTMISSVLLVVVGFLIISQMYFDYTEAKALYDGCQDRGGFPVIGKAGLSIDYFECRAE